MNTQQTDASTSRRSQGEGAGWNQTETILLIETYSRNLESLELSASAVAKRNVYEKIFNDYKVESQAQNLSPRTSTQITNKWKNLVQNFKSEHSRRLSTGLATSAIDIIYNKMSEVLQGYATIFPPAVYTSHSRRFTFLNSGDEAAEVTSAPVVRNRSPSLENQQPPAIRRRLESPEPSAPPATVQSVAPQERRSGFQALPTPAQTQNEDSLLRVITIMQDLQREDRIREMNTHLSIIRESRSEFNSRADQFLDAMNTSNSILLRFETILQAMQDRQAQRYQQHQDQDQENQDN